MGNGYYQIVDVKMDDFSAADIPNFKGEKLLTC